MADPDIRTWLPFEPDDPDVELETWLQSKIAPSKQALRDGEGNHTLEIHALRELLAGSMTAQEAAVAITRPITHEQNPPEELYRLWYLLADASVEMGPEIGHKTLDLLAAVQALPPDPQIDWSELRGFGNTTVEIIPYLHIHDPESWELELGNRELMEERKASLCERHEDLGIVEAGIWLRIPNAMNPDLGYDVLNLACSGRAGIPMFLHQIHGWLKVAGAQLWLSKEKDEMMSLPGGGTESRHVAATMEEHWGRWEKALVDLGGDESSLPAGSKEVAKECSEMMRKAREHDHRTVEV